MKKQDRQNDKVTEEKDKEEQSIEDSYYSNRGEPLPQPKDYEEIEY
ncbi:hypothetical protein GN156_13025 [bacterium LRH843]|nr:hypothetical protein [bacterium LRH843]